MENQAEHKSAKVKIERFSQSLMVALKQGEIAERAERAAHLLSDRDYLKEEAKLASKARKARIEELDSEMRRLSSEVREKVTTRDVECERHFLYAEKIVRDVRTDTGEELHRRPLTEQECQMHFGFPDDPPRGAGTGGGDLDGEFGEGEQE